MKIGIDVRCLLESKYSGISEYTYNLLNHLFTIDQQNQYILFCNSSKDFKNLPEFSFTNVEVKKYRYPNKIFNLAIRFLKVFKIDEMIGGVDIFLIPNFLFLNLSNKVKKILIVHDLSFDIFPEFFTFKKRLWHRLIGPKKMCQQADSIIAISENTKNDIIKLYNINPEKIKVINPGISEIFFKKVTIEQKQEVTEKYQLPEKYIYYLGNLEPRKNLKTLLQAFENLEDKDTHLVIAGAWGWKYSDISKVYENSKVKDKIKFLGYVDNLEKPALYSLAEIFVYPSIYEGFGLPPVESMACGTPVITSFSSSLPEAVSDAGLMIDPHNINELTKSIDLILKDKKLKEILTTKGMDNCQKFRWNKQSFDVLNIINQIKKQVS